MAATTRAATRAVPTSEAAIGSSQIRSASVILSNPSTGQVIARVPYCDAKQAGEVVEAAAACAAGVGRDAGC